MNENTEIFKEVQRVGKQYRQTLEIKREIREIISEIQDYFLKYPQIFTGDLPAQPIIKDVNSRRWTPNVSSKQAAYKKAFEIGRKNLYIGDDGGQNVLHAMNHKIPQIYGGHCLLQPAMSSSSNLFFEMTRTVKSYGVSFGLQIPFYRFLQETESKYCLIASAIGNPPPCHSCQIKTSSKCSLLDIRQQIPSLNFNKCFAFLDMPLEPSWIQRYHDSRLQAKYITQLQKLYDLAIEGELPLIGITHGGPGRDWAVTLSRVLYPNNYWEHLTLKEEKELLASIVNSAQQLVKTKPKLSNLLPQDNEGLLLRLKQLLNNFDLINNELDLQILDRQLWGLKYSRKTGERTPAFNIVRNPFVQKHFGTVKYGRSPFGMFFLGWSASYQKLLFPEFVRVSFLLPKNGAYTIEDIHKATFVQMVLGNGHPIVLEYSHLKAAPEQFIRRYMQWIFEKSAGFWGRTFKDRFKQF